jgi:hypothetical protein
MGGRLKAYVSIGRAKAVKVGSSMKQSIQKRMTQTPKTNFTNLQDISRNKFKSAATKVRAATRLKKGGEAVQDKRARSMHQDKMNSVTQQIQARGALRSQVEKQAATKISGTYQRYKRNQAAKAKPAPPAYSASENTTDTPEKDKKSRRYGRNLAMIYGGAVLGGVINEKLRHNNAA